jgi:two-component system NtrC family response regulator
MKDPVEASAERRARVLVVEDDASMGKVIRFNLEEERHEVTLVERGDKALELLSQIMPDGAKGDPPFDLVITDVKLPGADGMQVLKAARACHPAIQVVLVTAFGSVEHAIEAMAAGAADYITKPFRREEFKARVTRSLQRAELHRENRVLKEQVRRGQQVQIITASSRMQQVLSVLERVAVSDVTVLLSGESGTGKELAARLLHHHSQRSNGPFVPVNCAALPRDLLESELFGHVRGAFTGADREQKGKFEQANGGTLLLDEIGELPLELQAKLLRALEEGVIDKLGGQKPVPTDVRVVAATNQDLNTAVRDGRFREDLFHRLSVVPVRIPPLRERIEDIPILVSHFLKGLGLADRVSVAPALIEELQRRSWSGNVRELKNVLSRMALLRRTDVLDLADLAPPGMVADPNVHETVSQHQDAGAVAVPAGDRCLLRPGRVILPEEPISLPDLEREIVLKALEKHQGNRSAAARYLGVPRHVLLYRLLKYNSGNRSADEE